MIVYNDGAPRAIYFDSEGHVIRYTVSFPSKDVAVFDSEGRVTDESVELQLRTLGAEVVRVARRFADDTTAQWARECEESAERVVVAAP